MSETTCARADATAYTASAAGAAALIGPVDSADGLRRGPADAAGA